MVLVGDAVGSGQAILEGPLGVSDRLRVAAERTRFSSGRNRQPIREVSRKGNILDFVKLVADYPDLARRVG
jgi:hypothetical protein